MSKPGNNLIDTGIKALDFFAPITKGSLVRLPFQAGVGMLVLLGELCRKYALQDFPLQDFRLQDKGTVVWTGFTLPPFDLMEWEAEMSELGIKQYIHHSLASYHDEPDARRTAYHDGLLKMETLVLEGRHVLGIVQSAPGFENDIDESLIRLASQLETGSLTCIVMTPFPDSREIWRSLKAPYSGQITLDRCRVRQKLIPAIHPAQSLSSALTTEIVGRRHIELYQRTCELLDWYETVDPRFEHMADSEMADAEPKTTQCHALLRYFCQPFNITEPFTGIPGEQVSRQQLLDDVEKLLERV